MQMAERVDAREGDEDGALTFSDVGLAFRAGRAQRPVLDGIDLTIADGQFVSIVGHSGTGKTTLLRLAAGLLAPDRGTVRAYGAPVDGPADNTAFVFQDYSASMLPWRTVKRNVTLGIEGRVPARERDERATDALEMVGLGDRMRDYPRQLSGGMKQRVQIARALAMRPRALLMDEPFGALDAMTKAQLQDELQRVHALTRALVVFVTHDIEEAIYLSDRVIVLSGAPARVSHSIAVDLPRPREQVATKETPEYLRIRHAIYAALQREPDDRPA